RPWRLLVAHRARRRLRGNLALVQDPARRLLQHPPLLLVLVPDQDHVQVPLRRILGQHDRPAPLAYGVHVRRLLVALLVPRRPAAAMYADLVAALEDLELDLAVLRRRDAAFFEAGHRRSPRGQANADAVAHARERLQARPVHHHRGDRAHAGAVIRVDARLDVAPRGRRRGGDRAADCALWRLHAVTPYGLGFVGFRLGLAITSLLVLECRHWSVAAA